MTKAQLITAIKTAYETVSNDKTLSAAQAKAKLSTDIGTAVDTFVSSKIPNDITGEIVHLRDANVTLLKELMKQRIDIGVNLDRTVLTNILGSLESIL
ncbi:MAG: hypothetical protein ACPGSD_07695 [Flavobacteriales bacterium]